MLSCDARSRCPPTHTTTVVSVVTYVASITFSAANIHIVTGHDQCALKQHVHLFS